MALKNKPDVTVLLPAYNEEQSIGETVKKIRQMYPDFEVLVVDDGSTDNTMHVAMTAGATVWSQPYNIGNGAAIKKGLRTALGEWVIMMDADGQHDSADIARLLEFKGKYDMVVCARKRGSDGAWHRNLANWIYNRIASYVTRFKVKDLTSGFRLVRRDEARKFIYLLPNGFSYPTTLTMAFLRSGHSVKYIPIKAKKRKGKSKIKLLQDGTRFLLIIARIATLYSPFRVFLPISFMFFIVGFCYYFYTFFSVGRFTNMSALLLSTSVIVFMIGLVSEQVTQMRYDRVEE
ncbi:MAG: glycosyltransferase family 2 protein [Desulfobulbaceae bacterium]|nr:glycosyltransferase family 2 protein [Desulfobulbaceae bacterium]